METTFFLHVTSMAGCSSQYFSRNVNVKDGTASDYHPNRFKRGIILLTTTGSPKQFMHGSRLNPGRTYMSIQLRKTNSGIITLGCALTGSKLFSQFRIAYKAFKPHRGSRGSRGGGGGL